MNLVRWHCFITHDLLTVGPREKATLAGLVMAVELAVVTQGWIGVKVVTPAAGTGSCFIAKFCPWKAQK